MCDRVASWTKKLHNRTRLAWNKMGNADPLDGKDSMDEKNKQILREAKRRILAEKEAEYKQQVSQRLQLERERQEHERQQRELRERVLREHERLVRERQERQRQERERWEREREQQEREQRERQERERQEQLRRAQAQAAEDRSRILAEIKLRGIKWFVHFTQVENLESILENGLLTRDELARRRIDARVSDDQRLEQLGTADANAVCLSTMFPNYSMFYKKRIEDSNVRWCVLLLDANAVAGLDAWYYPTNAASAFSRDRGGSGYDAFMAMFADECDGVRRSDLGIPDFFTTSPQAEVQVRECIPAECITRVVLEDEDWDEMKDRLANRMKCHPWSQSWLHDRCDQNKKPWIYQDFFAPRCDWECWKAEGR